jgi:hypothetical protein
MSVIARRIRATPERSGTAAWNVITNLISQCDSLARRELETAAGVAACLIADEAPKESPIVIAGSGPRLRIYCLYGDDAVAGEDANEAPLTWNPTDGDWRMWLPAPREDVEWVSRALARTGRRVAGYDLERGEPEGEAARPQGREANLSIDVEAFKKP